MLDVHLNGTKNVCKSALTALTATAGEHGHAAIINTTSMSGMIGNFGQSNYGAAKAGIYGFTRVLSMELRKAGVSANCIAPVAKTRMTDDIDMVDDAWTAEQISPIIVYLASELSKGVTRKTFGVKTMAPPPLRVHERRRGEGGLGPLGCAGNRRSVQRHLRVRGGRTQRRIEHGIHGLRPLPRELQAQRAPGWTANIQWAVKKHEQTIVVDGESCTVKPGLEEYPRPAPSRFPPTSSSRCLLARWMPRRSS